MAEWRFLVVRYFGGSHQRRQTAAKIKLRVEQLGMSMQIPLVKFEVGRGREYFLGLAVNVPDADNSMIPDEARQVLRDSGIAVNSTSVWPLSAGDVAGLLQGTVECESFTLPIAFEREAEQREAEWECLVERPDDFRPRYQGVDEAQSLAHNKLLWWASAAGGGDLARLHETCRLLGISIDSGNTWSTLRRLVFLGHMEFAREGSWRWGVIEPVMVQKPSNPSVSYLAGQRSPGMLSEMRKLVSLRRQEQAGAPARIECDYTETLRLPDGKQVRHVGCAARDLAAILPSLADWTALLPKWDERDFGRHTAEVYRPGTDDFAEATVGIGVRPGFYRFALNDAQRPVTTLAFYSSVTQSWVCGDFYGLRFLARHQCRLPNCCWRPRTNELLLPISDRWPMPYERALVLASGVLPERRSNAQGTQVLCYPEMTEDLVETLCGKLDMKWQVSDE
jgi:hypothetical protein